MHGLNGVLSRYSLGSKYLVSPGPSAHELDLIAEAALRAPDHEELIPFRLCIVSGDARLELANLFESYARAEGKSEEACAIERERALNVPLTMAIIANIDMSHPIVPAHEQWMCIGGAITNILNAIHLLGYAGKMLSGGKVRNQSVANAFCEPRETLVGWIVVGTPTKSLRGKSKKSVQTILTQFKH